jgi:hypothetical protein
MVCEGAAKSEARAMSPKDFFRRGAAIAVQSYTKSGDYDTRAKILFCGGQQEPSHSRDSQSARQLEHVEYVSGNPVEIKLGDHPRKKFRLVCDPMYRRNCLRYPRGYITIQSDDTALNNMCYNVWDVCRRFEEMHPDGSSSDTRIHDGKYLIQVIKIEYNEDGVDATLHLHLTRPSQAVKRPSPATARKNLRARPAMTGYDNYTFELPITSCGSSNVVLLDLDRIKNRLWKPLQPETPSKLPTSVPEEESADSDSLAPVAKRHRTAASVAEQEPHDSGWHMADAELPVRSQQQGHEGIAARSPEAAVPNPDISFHHAAAAASQPATEPRHEASVPPSRDGGSDLGGGTLPTPSTAPPRGLRRDMGPATRPLRETPVARVPDFRKASDPIDESDSESCGSIETIVNTAGFPEWV